MDRTTRLVALALAAVIAVACGGSGLAVPTFELPTFDTAGAQQLLDDAVAEARTVVDDPPEIALPDELQRLLDENDIAVPQLPSNSSDICRTLGTPGASTLTAAGLKELIELVAVGGEIGLVVGLLVAAVFHTCPVWEPHLTQAIDDLL
jgi:hypothetical protein